MRGDGLGASNLSEANNILGPNFFIPYIIFKGKNKDRVDADERQLAFTSAATF
jgi:hypothetical protein